MTPETTGIHNRTPAPLSADVVETPAEDPLVERMIRVPDEDDFAEVLSPEGNSGDIVGSEISGSTTVSDAAVGGTG